ncbi:hypothetical protein Ahy_B03g061916 [Arachis hypogaea]|uniref:DUF223 domain-containing protein n=1 Tax=Arachis hypogaea TaxID=3818 RepID=A0A444ZSJ5_ARAHY|nr:hypothetical protein Ahy_B03g061916 [Arachis hypogaea]
MADQSYNRQFVCTYTSDTVIDTTKLRKFSIAILNLDGLAQRIHEEKKYTPQLRGLLCLDSLNKGYFKTTHHEYVVNLNQRTDVHRLPESSNVVGYLDGTENKRTLEKNSKSTKYTIIELEIDDEKIMECALFGNYAHELNAFLRSGNKDGAVVILQFVRVKLYNEKIVLQNSMYDTKNLLFEFSNEVATNDEFELLKNAITPTKRLSSKSEESKVEGDTSTCKKIKIEKET